ncbi:hypothetical protein M5689_022842 [Euphorbia peplus]|nr:hypothetical protein M5689_022842 [Euphorbia peplus]
MTGTGKEALMTLFKLYICSRMLKKRTLEICKKRDRMSSNCGDIPVSTSLFLSADFLTICRIYEGFISRRNMYM